MTPRRSFWAWGLESEEPTDEDRARRAEHLSKRFGVAITPSPVPDLADAELRPPRIRVPDALAACCTTETWERAFHSHGAHFTDRTDAFNLHFPNPTDVVAHPRSEDELVAVLDWCSSIDAKVVPFGAGSSVVWGVNPPEADAVVTVAMDRFDRVLELDPVSRAARIQAGIYGPELEDQLRPEGFTLRHFPQSFRFSTLGGWIATRSGGHYATNHTHIDDFVESVRMLTPQGWWESRRLPGSGAGPSPDRMVIGSEGILGVITEAWMRIQRRPTFRATAGIVFPTWEAGATRSARSCRPSCGRPTAASSTRSRPAAPPGSTARSRSSSSASSRPSSRSGTRSAWPSTSPAARAVSSRTTTVAVDDGEGRPTGRGGSVGAWRDAFIGVDPGLDTSLGLVADTFETAITWDRWPEFDALVRDRVSAALHDVFGATAELSCRFTHVYPDGPAPYYTWFGMGRQGSERSQWAEVKAAASEAVLAGGGTITHHHAVGRMHRPQYDRQRPELFASALRAAKQAVDPHGLLNPGVLLDPNPG